MAEGSRFDLVIVGAGSAGIGAAREAQARGLSVIAFEAMERAGGRAFTDHDTFGLPWDYGCHWLHSGSINIMREFADRLGFRYERDRSTWHLQANGTPMPPDHQAEVDASCARCYQAVATAGHAGLDLPVSAVVDAAEPGFDLFNMEIHAEWGVPIDQLSTLDATRYRDTDENWPVVDGYGAIVAKLAIGLPIETASPVTHIDWERRPAKVTTTHGVVEAGAVLITVSTNILAAETITFDPPLPDWKVAAAHAVPLGSANKVAFAIDGRYLGVEHHTDIVVPAAGGTLVSFQLRPYGRNMANGYLAGPLGRDAEAAGEEAMQELMLDALANAVGSDVRHHVTAIACSRWGAEPTILGAYAAALPGHADDRTKLATPLDDQLFFAGEATHPEFFSTCHGAYLSGQAAVEQVAAVAEKSGGHRGYS